MDNTNPNAQPPSNVNPSITPVPPVAPATPPPPAPPVPKKGVPRGVTIGLIVASAIALLALVFFAASYILNDEKAKNNDKVVSEPIEQISPIVLSGAIGLNGTPPTGSTISILVKSDSQNDYSAIVTSLPAADNTPWTWNGAINGENYEIKAVLQQNGTTLSESTPILVAAPATEEILDINYVPQLPTVAPNEPTPTTTSQVLSAISGTLNLNGYIPSGATVTISARQDGQTTFAPIVANIAAVDNSTWSYTNAYQNVSYEIMATLNLTGGTSQSQVLEVTAPASNEVLTINSTLVQPTPIVTGVSGTINLNGNVPSGSYITIGSRPTGSGNFNQIASNVSATNGSTWTWSGAQSGLTYDFQAYLWINNQPASQSQVLTAAAPAINETLSINAQNQPSAPTAGSITAACSNTSNGWQATISYNVNNAVQNAEQFWLTIGTTGGGSQIVSNVTNPANPNQTQSYTTTASLSQGTTYYTQYAVATCNNCSTYSSFSPSIPFTCN